ncbi:hypothetical protein ISN44_As12g031080 [Arabidopsis suecica]|uniref:Uncharacterized protein n=1 Tax=Arabidopsis suecica TaxID=45249 RepID=A0A8T1YPX9_ARASU|nr:hypothetical protein ISN44_As12g031080 [Arabidopsis suecica]
MVYLPTPIVCDIFRRVGEDGFRFLGPIIVVGPGYTPLVYTPECLDVGHPVAKYVDSLRILTQVGPSQAALNMLSQCVGESLYAHFAYGILLICCGALKEGMLLIKHFLRKFPTLEAAVIVGNEVVEQARSMGILGYRLFYRTFHFEICPLCCLEHHDNSNVRYELQFRKFQIEYSRRRPMGPWFSFEVSLRVRRRHLYIGVEAKPWKTILPMSDETRYGVYEEVVDALPKFSEINGDITNAKSEVQAEIEELQAMMKDL